MSNNRPQELVIEGARIIFSNFAGVEKQFNDAGDRNFCVVIDDPIKAQELREEGWNVRISRPRNEEDTPLNYIPVKVNFGGRPPQVFMVTSSNKVRLDEDTIGELDQVDIEYADVVINPYQYDFAGRTGVSAYLRTMYAVINEDRFAHKYDDVGNQF